MSDQGRDGWLVVGVVLASVALLASVFAIGIAMGSDSGTKVSAGGASMVEVTLKEFAVTPATIEVAAGGMLHVKNAGNTQHNLSVKGQTLATPMIDPGKSESLDLSALAPGKYTVICQVAGHEQAGMTASLTVTSGGATQVASGGHDSGTAASGATMTAAQMDKVMHDRTAAFPAKTAGKGGQVMAPKVLPDGTKEFDLTAQVVKWEIEPGKLVDAWTYNGTVPGPTIKVGVGDKVRVVLKNELPESTALHFHGILVPNSQDGVPDITQPPIKPGTTFTYEFTTREPAVGMYHSHHDAAKQVTNGLAGAFLVGEMPTPGASTISQEYPMMLDDSGTIGYSLNGKSFPATEPVVAKQGDWILVHYLNEGTQIHPMHLHGMPQLVVAEDGYPTATPQLEDTVLVAPGQRISVLVHATEVGTWAWHCHILPHAEKEDGMFGMVTALVVK